MLGGIIMNVKLALLGCGTVGVNFLKLIQEKKECIEESIQSRIINGRCGGFYRYSNG